MSRIVERLARGLLKQYSQTFRVVVVNGPRQAGKTTLLLQHHENTGGEFRTLDDPQTLRSALDDPVTFAAEGSRPCYIDEIQRGRDELVRAIKLVVDRDWSAGQFVLSGSARFLTVPTLSESLAGRIGLIEMWPLSMAERVLERTNFIDQIFSDPKALHGSSSPWTRDDYLIAICDGGYPEALGIPKSLRGGWYDSYISTIIQRDIHDFAQLQHARDLPQLLALIAARSGNILVNADLAKALGGLAPTTIRNYLSYFEMVFLLGYAPAWSTNLTSKIAKTPKVHLTDSGLMAHLLRVNPDALRPPGHPALGGLTETFVYTELLKCASLAETRVSINHFRDRDGREIDFVLETTDGRVVAIEVKGSVSPSGDALKNLTWLRNKLGEKFAGGILLHFGERVLPHGDRLLSAPISTLWGSKKVDDLP